MTAVVGLLVLGIVGVLMWDYITSAPTVCPDRCWDPEIADGRAECGGPCQDPGPLPCEGTQLKELRVT